MTQEPVSFKIYNGFSKDRYSMNFKSLIETNPEQFLELIHGNYLTPARLTHAAEAIGQVEKVEELIPTLLELSKHESPLVREGAILGMSSLIDKGYKELYERLQEMSSTDPSTSIQEIAKETLE